jgi:hypothetical protein
MSRPLAFRSLKFAEFQAGDGNQGVVSEGTTLFSGCQACRVEHVERLADGTRVVHAVTAEPSAAACPSCGVLSTNLGNLARNPG